MYVVHVHMCAFVCILRTNSVCYLHIVCQPPEHKLDESVDTHELKRGISLIMDHLSLATPPVMVHIIRMVCIRVC